MRNATYEMRMPTNYTDMSVAEMQYEGGFSWKTFGIAVAIVGAVALAVALGAGVVGVGMMAGAFGTVGTGSTLVGVALASSIGGLVLGFAGLEINSNANS